MGYTYLWEFTVAPERVAEFQQVYGPEGAWVALFRQSASFIGTQLLRDQSNPLRFVTIDRWRSEKDYQAFQVTFGKQYRELDDRCQRLTTWESALGSYDEPED